MQYSQHSRTSNKKKQENRHIRWDQRIIDQDSDNDEIEPQNDSIISKAEKKVNKFLEFFAEHGLQLLATIFIGAVLLYALSYAIFHAKNYMKAALKNQDAAGAQKTFETQIYQCLILAVFSIAFYVIWSWLRESHLYSRFRNNGLFGVQKDMPNNGLVQISVEQY